MERKYRVMVGKKQITIVDEPKSHGDILEHQGAKFFVQYTKGKCVFACELK